MQLLQFPITKRAILFTVASIIAFTMTLIFTVRHSHDYGMAVSWFVLGCTCLTLINHKRQTNTSA